MGSILHYVEHLLSALRWEMSILIIRLASSRVDTYEQWHILMTIWFKVFIIIIGIIAIIPEKRRLGLAQLKPSALVLLKWMLDLLSPMVFQSIQVLWVRVHWFLETQKSMNLKKKKKITLWKVNGSFTNNRNSTELWVIRRVVSSFSL